MKQLLLIPLLLITFIFSSCKEEEVNDSWKNAELEMDMENQSSSVTIRITVKNIDPGLIEECGFYWTGNTDDKFEPIDKSKAYVIKAEGGKSIYEFEFFPWDGLTTTSKENAGKCALSVLPYIKRNQRNITYGQQQNETVDSYVFPQVTGKVKENNGITIKGSIVIARGKNTPVIEHGIYWSLIDEGDKKIKDVYKKEISNDPLEDFTISFPVNEPGTIVNCVVYAKTTLGEVYSQKQYILLSGHKIEVSILEDFTGLTFERATVYGECSVENAVLYPITERGFCYINTRDIKGREPNIYDAKVMAEPGTGPFQCTITGLQAAASYKVRAYAVNSKGVTYSYTHVTLPMYLSEAFVPNVITYSPTVNNGEVTLSAAVISDRGYYVEERGFCYNNTGRTPTINDNIIKAGEGIGSFSATLKNLSPGKYFFKAYGMNEAGIGYSALFQEVIIE